ncbi:MAG: SGNH/GDSL hydrolase family protein [Longimicrobiales bacterium]
MKRHRAFTGLVLSLLLGCGSSPVDVSLPRTGDVLRVLFIGNSLTYWNTLPAIVEALADSAGVKPLGWKMVAYPDYALEDHWARREAQDAIAEGWQYVVLQQGPSSTVANRANLIQWTKQFNQEIRKTSGRAALYAVWPQNINITTLDASAQSYRLAADSVDGMLFPVSQAWKAAWQREPNAPLYSGDGLHPSPAGSYLAALVMVQQLYGRSPIGLPARLTLRLSGSPRLEIDPRLATILQEAAAEANAQHGRR